MHQISSGRRKGGFKIDRESNATATHGRGPLPLIADDADLVPLLRSAPNEFLDPLVQYIVEKGGQTAQLPHTEAFKRFYSNHQTHVDDIAAEIQKFGANTLVSHILKDGQGVRYAEIVKDFAKRVGVKHRFGRVQTIEDAIIMTVLSKSFEHMTPEQQRELLASLKIRHVRGVGAPATAIAVQGAVQASGFAAYQASVIVANGASQALLGHGLSFAANAALTKGLAVFAGPVGWAFSALLAANAFAGPAYRVTVPAVMQVALIRQTLRRCRVLWKWIVVAIAALVVLGFGCAYLAGWTGRLLH